MTRLRSAALVGNPNAGKSALFNALTGARQKIANYPGVTVERKAGRGPWRFHGNGDQGEEGGCNRKADGEESERLHMGRRQPRRDEARRPHDDEEGRGGGDDEAGEPDWHGRQHCLAFRQNATTAVTETGLCIAAMRPVFKAVFLWDKCLR